MSISVAKWCEPVETFFCVRQLPPVCFTLCKLLGCGSTGKIPAFLRSFCKRLTHWKLTRRVSSDWGHCLKTLGRQVPKLRRGQDIVYLIFFLSLSLNIYILYLDQGKNVLYFVSVNINIYVYISTQFSWLPLLDNAWEIWVSVSWSQTETGRHQTNGSRMWGQELGDGGARHLSPSTCPHSWVQVLHYLLF